MSGGRYSVGAGGRLSPVRMGVAERLGIAAIGCALIWAGVFWAIW